MASACEYDARNRIGPNRGDLGPTSLQQLVVRMITVPARREVRAAPTDGAPRRQLGGRNHDEKEGLRSQWPAARPGAQQSASNAASVVPIRIGPAVTEVDPGRRTVRRPRSGDGTGQGHRQVSTVSAEDNREPNGTGKGDAAAETVEPVDEIEAVYQHDGGQDDQDEADDAREACCGDQGRERPR